MAPSRDIHDPGGVSALIQKLPPGFASLVEAIRQTILSVDPEVGEQIKWNSPSFFYKGQMKPFDPKTYKRDIVVLNLHKGSALLVFPTGETVGVVSDILEGNYADGRRLVKIKDMADFERKKEGLKKVIAAWLSLVEK
ncbi:MAG: DUF1801 domain-containing protein [Haliscomenobacteraceae bacterium CHB4]|nr:hypothetical protein [Saprospiraceae bacterium]MCE7924672.1 DUF1801 domain-containing protein [Haliscomenobacteraceae bacterium CHB4]